MLTLGNTIDCANPMRRTAALNQGLIGWYLCVPGLYCSEPATTIREGSTVFDLSILPGGFDLTPVTGGLQNRMLHGVTSPSGTKGVSFNGKGLRPGGFGQSFYLNASTNKILLGGWSNAASWAENPARYVFSKTTAFSVFLWVAADNLSSYRTLIGSMNNTIGWAFYMSSPNGIMFALLGDNAGINGRKARGSSSFTAGKWAHVGLTYDGSNTAAGLQLYVDGQAEAMTVDQDTDPGTFDSTGAQVGVNLTQDATVGFLGSLDDVRIYNRVLGPVEVRRLYAASRSGYQHELNRINYRPFLPARKGGGILTMMGVG